MLKIEINHAKFIYRLVMIAGPEELRGLLGDLGMQEIGYPEGSGFSLWEDN